MGAAGGRRVAEHAGHGRHPLDRPPPGRRAAGAWRRGGAGRAAARLRRRRVHRAVEPLHAGAVVVLFLLAVWSVLCDDLPMLPVAVFAGSFCMQTHISYLGLVGARGPGRAGGGRRRPILHGDAPARPAAPLRRPVGADRRRSAVRAVAAAGHRPGHERPRQRCRRSYENFTHPPERPDRAGHGRRAVRRPPQPVAPAGHRRSLATPRLGGPRPGPAARGVAGGGGRWPGGCRRPGPAAAARGAGAALVLGVVVGQPHPRLSSGTTWPCGRGASRRSWWWPPCGPSRSPTARDAAPGATASRADAAAGPGPGGRRWSAWPPSSSSAGVDRMFTDDAAHAEGPPPV